MKLKEALKRAIRFCPGEEGTQSCLLSTDGVTTIMIYVDVPLPNVLLEAVLLSKVVKEAGEVEIEESGYGEVKLTSGGVTFTMRTLDFEFYPSPPALPGQFAELEYIADIKKVLPAAAKDKDGALLNLVHFTPEYVECTDKARLARASVLSPWTGVVPVRMFKHWPKGKAYGAFTEDHSFFWIGEEIRIAVIPHLAYPKTEALVPTVHVGGSMLVKVDELVAAVKSGTEVSTLSLVSLEMNSSHMHVRACESEGEQQTVKATVTAVRGNGIAGKVILDGRFLLQALKEVDTPVVFLGYGQEVDPLRIESANYVACIWQRI
jgi:DNA polymerase III sliding clamp (beta) subunit (PCNA family)